MSKVETKTQETYIVTVIGRSTAHKFMSVEVSVKCSPFDSVTDMVKSEGPLYDAGVKVFEERKLVLCAVEGCRRAAAVHMRFPFLEDKRMMWTEVCNQTECQETLMNTLTEIMQTKKGSDCTLTMDRYHECNACRRQIPQKNAKMCAKCKAAYYCDQKCADAVANHHATICVALVPCTFVVLAHGSKSGSNALVEINDVPACSSDQVMASWGGFQTMLTGIVRRHRIRGCAIKDCEKPHVKHICLCRSAEPKRWIVVYVCDNQDHQAQGRKLVTRLVQKPVSRENAHLLLFL